MGYDARFIYKTAVLSPAEVATITSAEQTFTVGGINKDDILVAVNKPTQQAGLAVAQGRVSAEDQVAISFSNPTAAGITPTASETYTFVIMRRQP